MINTIFIDKSLNFLSKESQTDFINILKEPPYTSIRYNVHKSLLEKNSLKAVPWCTNGYYLEEKRVFTLDPLLHAGAYYVQEASSMFLEQFVTRLNLDKDAVVLDLCASPGGKSTHLLNLLNKNQLLVSNEVIKSRVATLKENLIKWGCENIVITQNDSESFSEIEDFFDLIVVDAPCSGEGMFRKEKTALEQWSLENVEICYKRQRRILEEVANSVKEGGYLIYSTCTYNQTEDEENIRWFLAHHDYEEIKIDQSFPGIIECEYGYKLMPHLVAGEGFYICCLRKKGLNTPFNFPKAKFSHLDKFKNTQEAGKFLADSEIDFYTFHDTVKAMRPEHKTIVDYLSKRLNIITAGLDVAELLKNKEMLPIHSLAMSRILNRNAFNSVDLDKETALKFLKKELLDIDCENGLQIATYQNLPIGFFKKIQNRINNNYPQEWRIRMAL